MLQDSFSSSFFIYYSQSDCQGAMPSSNSPSKYLSEQWQGHLTVLSQVNCDRLHWFTWYKQQEAMLIIYNLFILFILYFV